MRVTIGTNGKFPIWARLLMILAGAGLILLGIRGLALIFTGEETTATITDVTVRRGEQTDNGALRTTVTQSYTYTVDGTEYTGSASFTKTSSESGKKSHVINSNFDQKFVAEKQAQKYIKIRYMPQYPQFSEPSESTEKSIISVGGRVFMILLGLLLLYLSLRPNKNKAQVMGRNAASQGAAAGYVTPQMMPQQRTVQGQQNQYYQQGYPQQGYSQPGAAQAAFCPNCGARNNGGVFCKGCGARLG